MSFDLSNLYNDRITAFAERDDELHGIAAGATAYLIKPFRPRQLRELAATEPSATHIPGTRNKS
ncbi:hypothetical protein [Paenarthrobacter aurescens]|uniref:Response regulatory domain-containing protein n=1 Tax=Paenarthrobacter aurescens TaxID=43663 RepID=A0A4Y3NKT9_PAEAU|nr:hypothetical protein [Paenarthrobacter aurescens]MDO6143149.1 hypothetical protein [Paenarthrobacter aurescens]MDO6146995.1 hypothetical protein [Paenarthrobacter aurescens]MDO6158241.1 hypothetical protein [Paenarthrobacter aurescens]MDO6162225.1 hypothetical protein [Paenarthrobacter aurescens]GEB19688.1 hypothetical protein AAU01_24430 [Paenarthrobacter aurescens]